VTQPTMFIEGQETLRITLPDGEQREKVFGGKECLRDYMDGLMMGLQLRAYPEGMLTFELLTVRSEPVSLPTEESANAPA
jgi:hypothetical protein